MCLSVSQTIQVYDPNKPFLVYYGLKKVRHSESVRLKDGGRPPLEGAFGVAFLFQDVMLLH